MWRLAGHQKRSTASWCRDIRCVHRANIVGLLPPYRKFGVLEEPGDKYEIFDEASQCRLRAPCFEKDPNRAVLSRRRTSWTQMLVKREFTVQQNTRYLLDRDLFRPALLVHK
jgi:hypothetical protein